MYNCGDIGFAVIGCGLISSFHIAAIDAINGAVLCGVYDSNKEIAKKTACEHNVKAYPSLDVLLSDPNVNAVCICTPSYLHGRMAIDAISAGKSVLIEKPIALSLEECDLIETLAREKNVQVGVVSQLRFSPVFSKVYRALEQGLLGRQTRIDLYMKYFRTQEYYDNGGWRGTADKDGGGALMNQGIHGVDLMRYLGGAVKSIYAISSTLAHDIEVEDTLSAVLNFKNGAIGVIEASTADWPGQPRRIELNGESGLITIEEDRIVDWRIENETGFMRFNETSGKSGSHNDPSKISNIGHEKQIENFVDALHGDAELLVGVSDGREALKLVLAAYKSAATGLPVDLDEFGKRRNEL